LINFGEPDLCRLHGLDFDERLEKEGLYVEKIDYRKKFTREERERYQFGNGERELIFRCTK
jgi:hypothetical protein